MKELELRPVSRLPRDEFNVTSHIQLVPPFQEKDIERYFPHFECVTTTSKLPKQFWTLLLQSVLVGKAQEAYSALSIEQSSNYDLVKEVILKAYELVPEAYRQHFRSYIKQEANLC